MALLQLVHQEAQPNDHLATHQYFDLTIRRGGPGFFDPEFVPVEPGWGNKVTYDAPRQGDLLRHVYLSLKLAPAPQGYRWKRLLPLHFIKSITVSVGGILFWRRTSEALQMKYRMDGFQTKPAWSPVPVDPEPEVLFDFSDEERSLRSQKPVEIFFEPIGFSQFGKYMFPLVCIPFHNMYFEMEIAKIEDCLEWMGPGEPEPIPAHEMNNYMLDCKLRGEYVFLDTDERRALAHGHIPEANNIQTKHFEYCSEVFEREEGRDDIEAHIHANRTCTSAYIWITDENNNEFNESIIDSFDIFFNGNLRESLTVQQSRFGLRDQMLHNVVPNNRTQNLYYVNYSSGRLDHEGFQQGCNFSRIDNYSMKFRLNAAAPQRFKIHMLHRSQNVMRVMHGMAGLRYAMDSFEISQRPFAEPVRDPIQIARRQPAHDHEVALPVFQNTDEKIHIDKDEKQCMITYTDFKENETVYKCGTCHKVFGANALEQWLMSRTQNNRKCVHCQTAFTSETFRKGKAHVGREAVVVSVAPQGLLHSVLSVFVGRDN